MRDIFIIGSKGIPAQYGGFETFVENLTKQSQSSGLHYHVACMSDKKEVSVYNGAECFTIKVPDIGPAKAVYYDMAAFLWCIRQIRKNKCENPVVYVLACRIGPFIGYLKKKLHRLGGSLYVNPDGHEFKRAKWSAPIRAYWKYSEKHMVKHADLLICDSKNIEQYIKADYEKYHPRTAYIAYGTKECLCREESKELLAWYETLGLAKEQYYLVVGRFVPENNYETMIRSFIQTDTKRKLVLVTNAEQNGFYDRLKEETHFEQDGRICFAGTVYNEELLSEIRTFAYAYIHGHEVGGTNPSLLEALSTTPLNLLLDVGFNREVGEDAALYWTKEQGSLQALIQEAEHMPAERRVQIGEQAKVRMKQYYSWERIVNAYEHLFLTEGKEV